MQGGVRANLFTALQKKSIICLDIVFVKSAKSHCRSGGRATLPQVRVRNTGFAVNKQQRLLSIGLQNFRAYFKFYAFIDGETIKQDSGECGMIGLR